MGDTLGGRKMSMEYRLEVITLYRYFAYATHMRSLFRKEVGREWLEMLSADAHGLLMFFYSTPGIYLLYSYSGIYLVIEGWKDLGLKDEKVDALIASPYVDRLRLFRNATFHFQKEPMSWKHLQFFGTEEEAAEKWLNELYSEFARYFRENTIPLPEQLQDSLKDKTHVQVAQAVREFGKEFFAKWTEEDAPGVKGK
jgi:hypothetical protein